MGMDLEAKKATIVKATTFAVAIVVCGVVGMYAYLILEGLMALAAVGGAGLLAWGAGPALGEWVANKRLAAYKAAIEANPIESMENLYEDKNKELLVQEGAIDEVATQFRNVDGLVKGLLTTDPDEAKDYVEIRDKIKEGLDELNLERDSAAAELKLFNKQIDKARRIWKVQLAVNTALNASAIARSAIFADIRKQVAFDKVTNDLNKSFARLDSVVRRRKNLAPAPPPMGLALPEGKPDVTVIDLTHVKAGQKVTVRD